MRNLDPGLKTHLESGATTLASCWRVDPAEGAPFGFTDHDVDIAFDGVTFEAASGATASGLEQAMGLSIDNATASGALKSERITEADIAAGRFDGAEIRQWTVNWADPAQRVLTFRGVFGEIRRGENAFEVELQSLSEALNRPQGRRYLPVCDAMLGDESCGLDVSGAEFSASGTVAAAVTARRIRVSGLGGYEPDWFARGVLTWTSGSRAGRSAVVRIHAVREGVAELELDRDQAPGAEAGETFSVIAGCDKRAETCKAKFQNIANFRGFPHIPGENWTTAYPVDGGSYKGGKRNG